MIKHFPGQLQNNDLKFILLANKNPIEAGWTTNNNYAWNSPKILNWRSQGRNIGIATGYGNILVVDFDSSEAQNEVAPKLPATFTVKTAGKGLHHMYFYCDDCTSWKVLAADKKTVADIQGQGKQIVAPGSKNHTTGRYYEVVKDIPIAKITAQELKAAFSGFITRTEATTTIKKQSSGQTQIGQLTQQVVNAGITVPKILQQLGISTTKNPTDCPFHSSHGGKCFSYQEGIWHCFHCLKGGNIADLLLEVQNGF